MFASHRALDERAIPTPTLEALEGRLLLCGDHPDHLAEAGFEPLAGPGIDVKRAVAVLTSATGMNVSGTVAFKAAKGGVEVKADIRGLTPGLHGFHVHAGNVCTPDDGFASALGHFNPTSEPHGAPNSALHHEGDMGNLVADKKGRAKLHLFLEGVSLSGADGFVGHTVIIHANPDDLVTQPTGNSGARVACGLIQAVAKGHEKNGHGHDDHNDDEHGDNSQRGATAPAATVFSTRTIKDAHDDLFD